MTSQPLYHYRPLLLAGTTILTLGIAGLSAWYAFSQLNQVTSSPPPMPIPNHTSLADPQLLQTLDQTLQSPQLLTAPIPTATLNPEANSPPL
jgi:hypothetical protein